MLRRVIYGLVVVAIITLCYVGYTKYRQTQDMMSGEVRRGPSEPDDSDASVPPPEASPKPAVHVVPPPPTTSGALPAEPAPVGAPIPIPTSDSIVPNPPNGMAYAGSGRFQVYRQGNITYRINTDTGQTCVLYATNEEWRKSQVYRHGCGNRAAQ